jgi:uncharacterized delta-60 repeat protein
LRPKGGLRQDPGIARFTRHGDFDRSFSGNGRLVLPTSGSDFDVQVAIQPDRRVLIASDRVRAGLVSRLTPAGNLDRSFGEGGQVSIPFDASIAAIEVQPDGKILLAGSIWQPETTDGTRNLDFAVVRLTRSGAIDRGFGSEGLATIDFGSLAGSRSEQRDILAAMALRADGHIVLSGTSEAYSEHASRNAVAIAVVLPNGTLDPGFGDRGLAFAGPEAGVAPVRGGPAGGAAVDTLEDGRIVAGGVFEDDFSASRFSATGAPDDSFAGDGTALIDGGSGQDLADALTIGAGEEILLAGSTRVRARRRTSADFAVLALAPDGSADSRFSGDGIAAFDFAGAYDDADDIEVRPNGKVLVSGTVGDYRIGLVRLEGP